MEKPAKTLLPSPTSKAPRAATTVAQGLKLQRLLYEKMWDEKTSANALAAVALAWTRVADTVRIARGIPDPGRLTLPGTPEQMTKAIRRLKMLRPALGLIDLETREQAQNVLGKNGEPPGDFYDNPINIVGENEGTAQAGEAGEEPKPGEQPIKTLDKESL